MEWVQMNGLAHDNSAYNELKSLLKNYKNDPDKWNKIYTFDTYYKKWYYLDGVKRDPYKNRD